MPNKTRRQIPTIILCKNCHKEFIAKLTARKDTKYCSRKCCRHAQHYNKLEWNRERNRKWYLKNRESELIKNKEYREQNRELFNWYHDKTRFDGVKTEVLLRDENKCQVCKKTEKLNVHHIDGNNYTKQNPNNDIKNLITLCMSCHQLLHWWQKKSKKQLVSSEDIVRTIVKTIEVNSKS